MLNICISNINNGIHILRPPPTSPPKIIIVTSRLRDILFIRKEAPKACEALTRATLSLRTVVVIVFSIFIIQVLFELLHVVLRGAPGLPLFITYLDFQRQICSWVAMI